MAIKIYDTGRMPVEIVFPPETCHLAVVALEGLFHSLSHSIARNEGKRDVYDQFSASLVGDIVQVAADALNDHRRGPRYIHSLRLFGPEVPTLATALRLQAGEGRLGVPITAHRITDAMFTKRKAPFGPRLPQLRMTAKWPSEDRIHADLERRLRREIEGDDWGAPT